MSEQQPRQVAAQALRALADAVERGATEMIDMDAQVNWSSDPERMGWHLVIYFSSRRDGLLPAFFGAMLGKRP